MVRRSGSRPPPPSAGPPGGGGLRVLHCGSSGKALLAWPAGPPGPPRPPTSLVSHQQMPSPRTFPLRRSVPWVRGGGHSAKRRGAWEGVGEKR